GIVAGLSAATAAPGLQCDIRFERAGNRMSITGLAMGEPGLEGRYALTARIANGSNRSVSSQGGRFTVGKSGDPAVVSRVSVMTVPQARVEVDLVLSTREGGTSCHSSTI